jgi:hypothetical protein
MRAAMSSPTAIERVEPWATGRDEIIDIETGPDGALYYVTLGGDLYRTRFKPSAQGIAVSKTHVWMTEGGQHSVGVSLATAPTGNVTVSVARSSGDADITVSAGSSLTFSTSNWSVPQTVTISSANDADSSLDIATLGLSSSGLTSESITVNAVESDGNALVVSTSALDVDEGASATFTVALAAPPPADVTVGVTRASGDGDITVSGGATLTFTAASFGAQTVTVAAAQDADNIDDSATLAISASGFAERSVAISGNDDDEAAPVITSTAVTGAVLDAPYAYTVTASGRPAPTFALDTAPSGMTIGGSTGAIAWTPAASGSFPVVVTASNGVAPDATQTFTIVVGADAPPTCTLIKPEANDVLSGDCSEFFGDGSDDVGTTRAEFFVDGRLGYSDVGTSGHYHWNSEHASWDTTAYANGAHQVRIRVTDTVGQSCEVAVEVVIDNGADAGIADAGTTNDGGPNSTPGQDAATAPPTTGDGGVLQPGGSGGNGAGRGGNASGAGRGGNSGAGNAAPNANGNGNGSAGSQGDSDLTGGCSVHALGAPASRIGLTSLALLVLSLALAARRGHRSS